MGPIWGDGELGDVVRFMQDAMLSLSLAVHTLL